MASFFPLVSLLVVIIINLLRAECRTRAGGHPRRLNTRTSSPSNKLCLDLCTWSEEHQRRQKVGTHIRLRISSEYQMRDQEELSLPIRLHQRRSAQVFCFLQRATSFFAVFTKCMQNTSGKTIQLNNNSSSFLKMCFSFQD